jgi:hypothetical protein
MYIEEALRESLLVGALLMLITLVFRLWNKDTRDGNISLINSVDLLIIIGAGLIGVLLVPMLRELSISISFQSDTEALVLASITLLFSVLTYVTLNTASDMRSLSEENRVFAKKTEAELVKLVKNTELEFVKYQAHLQLLSRLREAANLAELGDEPKELEVGYLQTLYKLFESEKECMDTLGILLLPDQERTRAIIFEILKEYIFAYLPQKYAHNQIIIDRISSLRLML